MTVQLAQPVSVSPTCSNCGKDHVVYRRLYSGESLCRGCFIRTFEKRVVRTISKYRMFRRTDKIAVALSGGKDSLSLLHVLLKIEKRFPEATLFAVTVDEGIETYRSEAIRNAVDYANKLGVRIHVVSFRELYGFDLTDILRTEGHGKLRLQPCSICGPLRRKAINYAAKELGATVVATAHTLDDVVQTFLMNAMRGDLIRSDLGLRIDSSAALPRVSPFRLTPEREVVFYAYLMGLPFQSYVCPNAHLSMRDLVRRFLTEYEEKYPGSLFAALSSFERLNLRREGEARVCEMCGEPTNRVRCRSCEILSSLRRYAGGSLQLEEAEDVVGHEYVHA